MHSYILADLFPLDNLFLQHRRRAACEDISLLFLAALVWSHVAPLQRRLVLRDNRHIHIRARAQVVEYTRLNRIRGKLHSLLLRQTGLPLRLKHGHGCQRAAAHGHVRELVRAAVRMHCEEAYTCRVHASHHEVRPDVALIAEEVLLEHSHAGHHAGLAARREGVQLELRRDKRGGELGVGGRPSTCAPDLGSDIMQLFAIL
jgi:hypothetical protein